VDPGTTTDVPPEGELQFFVVGVEECRAIANGDVRWSRALRGGSTSPQEGRSALSPQYRAFPVTGTRPGSTLYPVEPVTLVEAVGFCRRAGVACELWESAAGDAVGDGPVGIVLANGDWRVTG
jgi:hypothetical protein